MKHDKKDARYLQHAEQYKRSKFYKALQARSDELASKCGGMGFCDYCNDCGEKKPCVKAFRVYVRKTGIKVNYDDLKSIEKYF